MSVRCSRSIRTGRTSSLATAAPDSSRHRSAIRSGRPCAASMEANPMRCRDSRHALASWACGLPNRMTHTCRSAIVGLPLAAALLGCARAPQVPFENLRYSAALLTAASSRSVEQLDRVAAVIDDDSRSGRMSEQERSAYDAIIATMRSGRWENAEEACRRFRKAQLRR
jgi:hypothetical protein